MVSIKALDLGSSLKKFTAPKTFEAQNQVPIASAWRFAKDRSAFGGPPPCPNEKN